MLYSAAMKRVVPMIVFVVASLLAGGAFAQTSLVNATKYVDLRERLRRDFVAVGEGPGMSLVAQERLPGDYIRWADATIDLGWYLGVLATEHRLRSEAQFSGVNDLLSGIDTADELAAALLAMRRLDEQGDAAFPECGGTADLNGFFIRDDVPSDFHTNFAGMVRTRSDFIDTPTNKEMSQDQVYHVLMGLALVRALVPADVMARGISLSQEAAEQAERIIRKLDDDNWLIENPVCERDVARGHSATAYSPGIAAAGAWFTDGAYEPETSDVAKGIWDLAKDPNNGFYQNVDNLHMSMALSSIGLGWGAGETLDVLMALAEEHRWYAYPLVAQVLHRNADWCDHRDTAIGEAAEMIDELPSGVFPANPRPDTAVHGYTQWNRFIRGSEQHYVGPEGNEGREQHGLDYMLLHNLAALAAPELWADDDAPCEVPSPAIDMAGSLPDAGNDVADMGSNDPTPDLGSSPDMAGSVDERPTETEPGCGCATGAVDASGGILLVAIFGWRRRCGRRR